MIKLSKISIIIILALYSCRPDFKYNGLRVKFIKYEVEKYAYSGHGWDNAYTLYFQVIKENEYYEKEQEAMNKSKSKAPSKAAPRGPSVRKPSYSTKARP